MLTRSKQGLSIRSAFSKKLYIGVVYGFDAVGEMLELFKPYGIHARHAGVVSYNLLRPDQWPVGRGLIWLAVIW